MIPGLRAMLERVYAHHPYYFDAFGVSKEQLSQILDDAAILAEREGCESEKAINAYVRTRCAWVSCDRSEIASGFGLRMLGEGTLELGPDVQELESLGSAPS